MGAAQEHKFRSNGHWEQVLFMFLDNIEILTVLVFSQIKMKKRVE